VVVLSYRSQSLESARPENTDVPSLAHEARVVALTGYTHCITRKPSLQLAGCSGFTRMTFTVYRSPGNWRYLEIFQVQILMSSNRCVYAIAGYSRNALHRMTWRGDLDASFHECFSYPAQLASSPVDAIEQPLQVTVAHVFRCNITFLLPLPSSCHRGC